jgi:hypoxanthine phosphoribosyltransferase
MTDHSLATDIAEILIPEDALRAKVAEIGAAISRDYASKDPLLVGMLKGGTFFLADLIRSISIPIGIDFIAITS